MSTAERARKDIFTALTIATVIIAALGIALGALELHRYSVTPRATMEPATRPAKTPEVIKTEGGAAADEAPKGDSLDGAAATSPAAATRPAAGATGANP